MKMPSRTIRWASALPALVIAGFAASAAAAQSDASLAASIDKVCRDSYGAKGAKPAYSQTKHNAACGCLVGKLRDSGLKGPQLELALAVVSVDRDLRKSARGRMSATEERHAIGAISSAISRCRPD
ncbi:MAG: hypothetical protein MRY74_01570 [Neomegalonema sp.]|nr:hypothetical protein [Neomegalonema sp.]